MAIQTKMANINFFNFELINENFRKMYKEIRAGNSCSVFGVQNSMRAAISSSFGKNVLYLTSDQTTAGFAAEQFKIMGFKTIEFPSIQDSFIYKKAQSNENYINRTIALYKILNKDFNVVVAPISALYNFLPSVKEFKENILKIRKNQSIMIETLERLLSKSGYKKEELIFAQGQYSRRGEIIDIFPIDSKVPFRIDFFDTVIETIKVFDITTQKGTKEVNEIKICPYTDLFLSDDELDIIKHELEKLKFDAVQENSEKLIFNNNLDDLISRIELGDRSYSLEPITPYLQDYRDSIFDYLSEIGEFVVVIDECKQVFDNFSGYYKEIGERIKSLQSSQMIISKNLQPIFSQTEVLNKIQMQTCLAFLKITNSNNFFKSKAVFNFKTLPASRYVHNLKEFSVSIKTYIDAKYKVFVFAGSKSQAETAEKLLISHDIDIKPSKITLISSGDSAVFEEGYYSGFVLPEEKIVVVGTYDIFPKKRSDEKLNLLKTNVYNIPKLGDYVVHHIHGIGVCEGVTKLSGNFGTQDYIVVRYRDNDRLYVPTTQMDLLDKFSGADVPKRLSKIGGQDFASVKSKVKESVKKLAFNLVELYAKRESIKGFAFSEDNSLQLEFENSFPYTETEDQLVSIEEIKQDMQKPKVMDRLVCGDVGFGKTEVALRAAFKAIADGKQVAFIAPTTILSEQHYNTALSRMYDFGITIEVLNRFKTKAQTEKILKDIEMGNVDLVCGTHRVFSDDVKFKNLGLIVLDEEQKFGVEDKERLKVKYPTVDFLTLSATPIPRTLNMSLSGIRDISMISTPPSERLPVQTYVTEFSETLIKDAISRELARDGQVFILFNNVEKIYTFAERIRRIVPEAKILVAHGQMGSKQMEKVVYDFYHRQGDILVCTTIIENGIDIENANTLIVYDADKLGLSQLYQIRGRVGRGSRMAYAYFMYEKEKILSVEAYKRLDALSQFCEFGSGFKLAMRDLEIRGGGNILGPEQSGHMQKVGYDMYAKLLAEAVNEIKGQSTEGNRDVLVKVAIDAFVPDSYIATSEERMILYKKISNISSVEDLEKLKLEIKQNYGQIPKVVENLMEIALVRHLAIKINATQILSTGAEVDIIFDNKENITQSEVLGEAIYKFRLNCSLDMSKIPMIKFTSEKLCSENFEIVKKFLSLCNLIVEKLQKN